MEILRKYKIEIIVLIMILFLSFVAFGTSLNNFFVSDDFDWVHLTANKDQSIIKYFTTNYYGQRNEGGSYRPFFNVWFYLNYKVSGLNPFSYHLLNIVSHGLNAFLIFLLSLIIFAKRQNKKIIAVLASLIFLLLPSHAEAVNWPAALGDPLSTLFYLLAFYLYLQFKQKKRAVTIILSLLSFVVAILHKETALTLPLVIICWELLASHGKREKMWQSIINLKWSALYLVILAAYPLIRYSTIGLGFGYYGRSNLQIDFAQIGKTLIDHVTTIFFYGNLQNIINPFFYKYFYIFFAFLVLIFFKLFFRKNQKPLFLFLSYFIAAGPTLFLLLNPLNDAAERYNYLPSVFAAIFLAYALTKLLEVEIKKIKVKVPVISIVLIILIFIYFGWQLNYKNSSWEIASYVSQTIIDDFGEIVDLNAQNEGAVIVALPDSFEGAHLMRNGIKQAINLYYPDYDLDAIFLPIYLQLNRQNINKQIMEWEKRDDGYLAQSIDKSYVVTGFDRRESDDLIFELWGYNYSNYTSDKIRLIFKQQLLDQFNQKKIYVLVFDQGRLKDLDF